MELNLCSSIFEKALDSLVNRMESDGIQIFPVESQNFFPSVCSRLGTAVIHTWNRFLIIEKRLY